MSDDKKTAIKLRHISIRNYKGIDSLDLDFPEPLMSGDPDVLVMGSENGLGKTSVLECCALLLLGAKLGQYTIELYWPEFDSVDIPDLVIRAGTEFAEVTGELWIDSRPEQARLQIDRDGTIKFTSTAKRQKSRGGSRLRTDDQIHDVLRTIWGFSPDPIAESSFLSFNSYRKVQEGNPDLGMMVERAGFRGRNHGNRDESTVSALKVLMLRTMMGKADLFELDRDQGQDSELATLKLNELLHRYAGGAISKLRPSPDNTVDFRIIPESGGAPFTFDGLSSGQKEIISTLFLVWFHTRNNPLVVLIDEPELHLNAQWHRSFIRTLFSLAPDNQYVMATHSEFVMDSVDEDRRVLLSTEPEVVR